MLGTTLTGNHYVRVRLAYWPKIMAIMIVSIIIRTVVKTMITVMVATILIDSNTDKCYNFL